MRRRQLHWLVDPTTDPRRYVSLRVAARYLECDPRTLNKWLEDGLVTATSFGLRRKIAIAELIAFEERQRAKCSTRNGTMRQNAGATTS